MTAAVLAKVPGIEVNLIAKKGTKNADKRTTAISDTNFKFINQNITTLGQKLFWPSKKIELFYETSKEKINFLNLNEANSNLMYVFENDKVKSLLLKVYYETCTRKGTRLAHHCNSFSLFEYTCTVEILTLLAEEAIIIGM